MIKLSQMKEQEIRRGMTLAGPHRDDLAFILMAKKSKRMDLKVSDGRRRYL